MYRPIEEYRQMQQRGLLHQDYLLISTIKQQEAMYPTKVMALRVVAHPTSRCIFAPSRILLTCSEKLLVLLCISYKRQARQNKGSRAQNTPGNNVE